MKKRVIVADDHKENRELVSIIVERTFKKLKENCSIEYAINGKELYDKTIKENYDLIFSDENMPRMEGSLAIKKLREQGYKNPAYIVTSEREKCMEEVIKECGANGYINKLNMIEGIERAIDEQILSRF